MPLFRGFRGKKGSKLTKILVIVLAITFVGGLLYTGTVIVTNPTQAGEIMATVNGRAITRAAFEQGYTNAVLSDNDTPEESFLRLSALYAQLFLISILLPS